MYPAIEVPFSDLVNKPRDTVATLLRSRLRHLRLRRRDAEDLVLTTVSRREQEHQVVSVTTRLIAALLRHPEVNLELIREALLETFPWARFLPNEEQREFLDELVAVLRAVEDLESLSPAAQLITEWRHTAEVHANPTLATTLAQDTDDLGPVPAPQVPV